MRRDSSAPIPLPEDDGETRLRRSTARETAQADGGATPVAERDAAAPTEVATRPHDGDDAAERIRNGPVTVEKVQVHRPALSKRERRGAAIAGALGLPLATLGLIALAVPIGAGYVTTLGLIALTPAASGMLFWLMISGAVLLLAGLLLSWLVLRAHGVFHPMLVTLSSMGMSIGLSLVLQAAAGALAGLVFGLGVEGTVFADPLLLFGVASVVMAVLIGIGVWRWMASVLRATVVTGAPETVKG